MSYKNIPRKCSVCECCGSCDYEYEAENDCVSGDYSPLIGQIKQVNNEYIKGRRLTSEESLALLYPDPPHFSDEELDKIIGAFVRKPDDDVLEVDNIYDSSCATFHKAEEQHINEYNIAQDDNAVTKEKLEELIKYVGSHGIVNIS